MYKNKFLNISNSLSFLRLVLTVPVCWLLLRDNYAGFLILGIIAMLTDFLDGFVARKRDEITEFGKIIDPVADKVLIGAVAIVMLIKGLIPLWFLLTVLSRDIMILLGGLYLSKKLGYVIYSDFIGKISVNILAIVMICIIFRIEFFSVYGLYIALAALLVSLANYFVKLIILLKEVENK
ncbi:MAG: hypothetical protein A2X61_13420 [Ignavibacteria bacterium GWB2_35_12]|nr:MAG: hypothetical protein A2X61_13420 [Ignavibacteria bacterium GWB2_35_12]